MRAEQLQVQLGVASKQVKRLEQLEEISRQQVGAELRKQWELEKQLLARKDEAVALRKQVSRWQCDAKGLQHVGIDELEALEADLRAALERVGREKARRLQNQLEPHLCIVCFEGRKSVVTMPCRHMCLCAGCAERVEMA